MRSAAKLPTRSMMGPQKGSAPPASRPSGPDGRPCGPALTPAQTGTVSASDRHLPPARLSFRPSKPIRDRSFEYERDHHTSRGAREHRGGEARRAPRPTCQLLPSGHPSKSRRPRQSSRRHSEHHEHHPPAGRNTGAAIHQTETRHSSAGAPAPRRQRRAAMTAIERESLQRRQLPYRGQNEAGREQKRCEAEARRARPAIAKKPNTSQSPR